MKAAGLALLLSWGFRIGSSVEVDRSDDFTAVSPLTP
jgi:hypothetical protein